MIKMNKAVYLDKLHACWLGKSIGGTIGKYATMDAMVDHGIDEGTCAEIFTAAIQSAAYVESDIHKLLEIGLSKIPVDCAVAKTIRLVMEMYSNGIDYKETREKVVQY